MDGVAQIEDLATRLRTVSALGVAEHRPVDVGTLVKTAMEPLRDLARSQGIRLSVSIAATLKQLDGDGEALAIALRAIVDNAIRYNHRGGEVRLEAKILDKKSGPWITFLVTDSGVGIPESELPSVFQAYKKRASETSRGTRGLGAGLAVARRVFVNHGGDVSLESWLGRGTAVTLTLPQPDPELINKTSRH